jgi:hypothetical protein
MSAAVGFTVKSGWAAAVVVERVKDSIRVVESRLVDLCDPAVPESKQPYHDGFATMRKEGPRLTKLLDTVQRAGGASVTAFLDDVRRRLNEVTSVGVVVGSLIDPATIGNEHIRIHAMEGQLFRTVVTTALEECGIPFTVWRERDLPPPLPRVAPPAEGPWRKEQKLAALAASLALGVVTLGGRGTGHRPVSRGRR